MADRTRAAHATAYARLDRPLDGLDVTALPADGLDGLVPFGLVVGPRVHQARRFRHVTLPPGWEGRGDQYGMWTHLVDEYGRTRALVDWQPGAGPNARASTIVIGLAPYVQHVAEQGAPLALDRQWATRDAVVTAVTARRDVLWSSVRFWQERIDTFGDHSLGNWPQPNTTLSTFRDHAAADAARYEVLLHTVVSAPDRPGMVPGWPSTSAASSEIDDQTFTHPDVLGRGVVDRAVRRAVTLLVIGLGGGALAAALTMWIHR